LQELFVGIVFLQVNEDNLISKRRQALKFDLKISPQARL
jgi:hypothetical protein